VMRTSNIRSPMMPELEKDHVSKIKKDSLWEWDNIFGQRHCSGLFLLAFTVGPIRHKATPADMI